MKKVIWTDAHLTIRVAAAQEAIKRSRFAFFLCILAASASFVCLWNAHISWYRGFGFNKMPAITEPFKFDAEEQTRAELTKDVLKAWVESQSITINLLGIHIGVSDFAVLNSIALFVFVYYYLLTARRENREIGQLLRDAQNDIDKVGYTVYAAIASYMVFNLNKQDDSPIENLDANNDRPKTKIGYIRLTVRLLFYLPLFTVLFTILCDICSVFSRHASLFSSPFRTGRIWDDLKGLNLVSVIVMEMFSMFVAYGIWRLNLRAVEYENATRKVLDEFQLALKRARVVTTTNSES